MNDSDDDLRSTSSSLPERRVIYAVATVALLITVSVIAVQRSDETPEPATAVDLSAAALATEKQEQIWEVEHFAFELETFFGKPLRAGPSISVRFVVQSRNSTSAACRLESLFFV
jgi:hypothetical protein